MLSQDLNIPTKARRKVGYNYKLGDVEHRLLAKVLESYATSPDGVSVWITFNDLKGVEQGILSLAAIKLERVGFLDKNIAIDHEYNDSEYYAFSITADGIDYLLENEELLHKANERVSTPVPESFDDDITF